jgi:hypothetical protein
VSGATGRVRISRERTVNTYAELWHGSRVLLEMAEKEPPGYFWILMSAHLLTAFTLEAYLNHIGPKLFTSWKTLEPLTPLAKLDLVAERLELSFPPDVRPGQAIRDLFRFRNAVAHGKTVTLRPEDQLAKPEEYLALMNRHPPTLWEKELSTIRRVRNAREDVEKTIREIHAKAKPKNDPLFFMGLGIYSASSEG